jgi:pimeloyl-ACP methyl ester carboxylesterase
VGQAIETQGLMRLKSYVGKLPEPRTYEEDAEILRRMFSAQFPRLSAADWTAWAQRTWKLQGTRLVPTYDVRLARTLYGVDPEWPLPPLWPQFDALGQMPLMVVRGPRSDLLSADTLAKMRERHRDMTALEIPDQGHTPLLNDAETMQQIARFVARCERSAQP